MPDATSSTPLSASAVQVPSWLSVDAQGTYLAAVLDTETSGLDSSKDQIIEIGIRLIGFELPSGKLVAELDSYSALQDPGFPISMEIQGVTGIFPSMLIGQSIDWAQVDGMLARVDVILAHNAAFDRGFVDRKSSVTQNKVWACTSMGVDWRAKGFKNAKLQDLCGALGIVYQAHRAMSDVEAVVRLMGSEDVFTNAPYMAELIQGARKEVAWIWLEGQTFDHLDEIKKYGFRWNGVLKSWGKLVDANDHESQMELYRALFPKLTVRAQRVTARERYKST